MEYTVIILVDGHRVATNRHVLMGHMPYVAELDGPDLHDFVTALKLTGKAMNVRHDATGVTVVLAHEEI